MIGGENENGELAAVAITSVTLDGEQSFARDIGDPVVPTAALCRAVVPRWHEYEYRFHRYVSVFDGEREIHRVGVADSVFHRMNDSNLQTG